MQIEWHKEYPEINFFLSFPEIQFWSLNKAMSEGIEKFGTSQACKKRKKVKVSRYRPGVAQRVGKDVALLLHDRGTRRR